MAAVRTVAALFSTPLAVAGVCGGAEYLYDFNSVPRVETPPPPEPIELLSCDDPNLLPIWQRVKKDKEFRDRTSDLGTTLDCATLLDVRIT